jgi:hypothetical protein
MLITLLVMSFKLRKSSEKLSRYDAHVVITHMPKQCYVRLEEL